MLRARVIGLLLALATLLAYLPATHYSFINFDDDDYVTQNQVVQKGLTWEGVKWAFTTWHASNWHPVTWLSHMADCQLFHLNPGGHHFVNVLFHAANATLLFLLLMCLTTALWPSAFVAALFAWHPMHVESVAWISERKDVLSTFFALLALLAYVRFARENHRGSFWLTLIFLALGLMSKPMVVTLPFIMLLLDYWPLQRLQDLKFKTGNICGRILEKWPFFLLTLFSTAITFLAQRSEAVKSLVTVPLVPRLENAVLAYGSYLLKAFWPAPLAVFYPLPAHIAWWRITIAAAALLLVSAIAWRERRRKPWVLVGWLWFLGSLVPVIGLVQVGDQAMADRYGYIPLIGVFIAVTFTMAEKMYQFQFLRIPCAIAGVLVLSGCLVLTEFQLRYWRDSISLFSHAVAVTKDNATARINLGAALEEEYQPEAALTEYQKALQLDPNRHEIFNNIGKLLNDEGQPGAALNYCREAVRLNSNSPLSHNNLGMVLAELGHFEEALGQFSAAAQLDAAYASPRFQMGKILLQQGHDAEALPRFHEALQIEPDNPQMLVYLARVLAADDNPQICNGAEALGLASKASQLIGTAQPVVLDTLAMAYAETGRFDDAVQTGQAAVNLARQAGLMGDVAVMQQRLDLYQKHQPWRESFRKN